MDLSGAGGELGAGEESVEIVLWSGACPDIRERCEEEAARRLHDCFEEVQGMFADRGPLEWDQEGFRTCAVMAIAEDEPAPVAEVSRCLQEMGSRIGGLMEASDWDRMAEALIDCMETSARDSAACGSLCRD